MLIFTTERGKKGHSRYYLPTVQTNDYNVMTNSEILLLVVGTTI